MGKFLKRVKVSAALVGIFDGKAIVNVSEQNETGLSISSADVRVCKAANNSRLSSRLLRKISSGSEYGFSVPFRKPVDLCGDSCDIWVPLKMSENQHRDYILGEKFRWDIVLNGSNERGEKMKVKVKS
jgi:hypothetical protein